MQPLVLRLTFSHRSGFRKVAALALLTEVMMCSSDSQCGHLAGFRGSLTSSAPTATRPAMWPLLTTAVRYISGVGSRSQGWTLQGQGMPLVFLSGSALGRRGATQFPGVLPGPPEPSNAPGSAFLDLLSPGAKALLVCLPLSSRVTVITVPACPALEEAGGCDGLEPSQGQAWRRGGGVPAPSVPRVSGPWPGSPGCAMGFELCSELAPGLKWDGDAEALCEL